MDIIIYTTDLRERIKEVVSRAADAAYNKDGISLYDSIVLTERDMNTVDHAMAEAAAKLSGRCARFLEKTYDAVGENKIGIPESWVYTFSFSERRALNKKDPLTEAMSSFMLDYCLAKIYSDRGLTELANKYDAQAVADGGAVETLLYTKLPPIR